MKEASHHGDRWDTDRARFPRLPAARDRRPAGLDLSGARLGGIKSLYSDSYFTREAFARSYGMEQYEQLKAKYDWQQRAPHLYDKCVRRQ